MLCSCFEKKKMWVFVWLDFPGGQDAIIVRRSACTFTLIKCWTWSLIAAENPSSPFYPTASSTTCLLWSCTTGKDLAQGTTLPTATIQKEVGTSMENKESGRKGSLQFWTDKLTELISLLSFCKSKKEPLVCSWTAWTENCSSVDQISAVFVLACKMCSGHKFLNWRKPSSKLGF